jgi:hypothetical protein
MSLAVAGLPSCFRRVSICSLSTLSKGGFSPSIPASVTSVETLKGASTSRYGELVGSHSQSFLEVSKAESRSYFGDFDHKTVGEVDLFVRRQFGLPVFSILLAFVFVGIVKFTFSVLALSFDSTNDFLTTSCQTDLASY